MAEAHEFLWAQDAYRKLWVFKLEHSRNSSIVLQLT